MLSELKYMDRTDKKILITGFDPFGGERINPSWEAVLKLPDQVGKYALTKLQIPTEFGRAAACVLKKAYEINPDIILCIGQAGGRSAITLEVVAINLRDASIADNAGNQPVDTPGIPSGPAAYFSTIPVRQMTAAIKECNIPSSLSYSAGTYVCNDVLYTLLHQYNGTQTRVGFIHVPFLPEQVKNNEPYLPLEQIVKALSAAIEIM